MEPIISTKPYNIDEKIKTSLSLPDFKKLVIPYDRFYNDNEFIHIFKPDFLEDMYNFIINPPEKTDVPDVVGFSAFSAIYLNGIGVLRRKDTSEYIFCHTTNQDFSTLADCLIMSSFEVLNKVVTLTPEVTKRLGNPYESSFNTIGVVFGKETIGVLSLMNIGKALSKDILRYVSDDYTISKHSDIIVSDFKRLAGVKK